MGAKISLQVVRPEMGKDSIISVMDCGFPVLKGEGPDHLACGNCGDVLAWNLSCQTVRKMFMVVYRLVFRCGCGALNLVPSVEEALKMAIGELHPLDERPVVASQELSLRLTST